ncbi:uncharacterized protein LOC131946600 [Physella acuta]|uniref:uncharacterized protein LOC131946600 n=1 Tax=Physella acuta TaxID=109671 RepID=UPI0027DD3BF7|nr:uncharacterized protein LOC131946600 [Physella acuta]XP_059163466.1 uncharacterized protein LOC131946600 [Physella acuta]XP_059163467.1 uncharacterized protein LOC131946600 [Physella acuta]XP_059163469.1 uncharacterized protein LOC131946600 [Physella acuta]XP_059163470.1 uncharacterized protein LOC131946600 [Physella acuta]XP_059163471.1 uncharacterized protein LOC131946600 [Physella acuta]
MQHLKTIARVNCGSILRQWALLLLALTISLVPLVSPVLTSAADGGSLKMIVVKTSVILYKDDVNEGNVINCSVPGNTTALVADGKLDHDWTPPKDVQLIPSAKSATSAASKSWVELTSQKTLVFHEPDESVSGEYTCRTRRNDQDVALKTVHIRVMTKTSFDTNHRIKVAFIIAGVFFGCMCIFYGAYYWRRRRKMRMSEARNNQTRRTFEIPTILVVDMSETDNMMEEGTDSKVNGLT